MWKFTILLAIAGCGTATEEPAGDDTASEQVVQGMDAVGHCLYTNTFSQAEECKEYVGADWTAEDAAGDCAAPMPGAQGTFVEGDACARDSFLGECFIDADMNSATTLVFFGEQGDDCSSLEFGCNFAGGVFEPSPLCDGSGGGAGVPSTNVFVPFERICTAPLQGEPEGQSEGGDVCTWQAISGATEEGRRFDDYASCEVVQSQRPYWPASVDNDTTSDDPRLDDPEWVAEYEWVTAQVEASACVCCHTERLAPSGPSGWYLEADPIWTDTLDDDGMAMMAGWVDSTVFGAFPAEQNNGFTRDGVGVPTNDVARMVAYFEGELARRGLSEADFADTEPFGGPLFDQLVYEPEACGEGEGIDASGVMSWNGGPARYLYVMEAGSDAPGVPPNLDLPEGTLWRLDVSHTAEGVESGLRYGDQPDDTWQVVPEVGAPPALVSGEAYYLYVLADVYQPITRCLFTAQ